MAAPPGALVPLEVLIEQRGSAMVEDALAGLEAAPTPEAARRPPRTAPAGPSADTLDAARKALSTAIDGVTVRDLVQRTGLPEGECKAALDVLSRIGDADRRGTGRGTRWYAAAAAETGV